VRKESAEARVICPVCANDMMDTVKGPTEVHAVFGKLFVSTAVLEDVRPGLWVGVRELVGGNADYGAVLLVEFEQYKRKSAIDSEPEPIQV
jgi:hypothetical protein